jgi:hypothetical protein
MIICRDVISHNCFFPHETPNHYQNIVNSDSLFTFVVCTEFYVHSHECKNIGISLAHALKVHGHHTAVLHLRLVFERLHL